MPFPLLAHQAPVLPLKARWPNYFNGTALVVGSIAPDLQLFWTTKTGTIEIGHTFVGQFTFCLPLTMSVVLLVGNLRLGEIIASRLGARFAWLTNAATDVARSGGIERAIVSALVGSFSHVGFDMLTHDVIPARTLYHVRGIAFSTHAVAQAVASLIGAVIALAYLRAIYLHSTRDVPDRRAGASLLGFAAGLGAAVGLHASLDAIRHPDWYFEAGRVYVWGYVFFLVTSAAIAGVLVAAAGLRAFDDRP